MKHIQLLAFIIPAFAVAATTESIFARMDSAAQTFRGMTAKIRWISYTAIIKESAEESGTIVLRSQKTKSVAAKISFEKPNQKVIAFRDKKAQNYLPKINTVQEFDLGKYDNLLTQGLLIGFATPTKDIQKNYSVKMLGEETVENQKCSKLELLPTQQAIKQHIARIELWVSNDTGLPAQEKLYQPSGDYTQIIYSDMKLEPGLTDDQVTLKLPANVKREYPQK